MTAWYDEDFSEDDVYEFFRQCKEFTAKSIEKSGIKDFKHKTLNFFEPESQHTFSPMGIVVSATKSVSIWDTLLAIASRSYNTHFIISNRKPRSEDGSLLKDFPATVIIPATTEHVVHHASYMSPYTWGIDIRNLGKVRPYFGEGKPVPIYNGEETDKMFTGAKNGSRYFWWDNLWRQEYEGNVDTYGTFVYEHPLSRQVETLLALIKILSKISSIKREFIVPLDCVVGGKPVLPNIKWEYVRNAFFGDNHHVQENARTNLLKDNEDYISDWHTKEARDEYFLRELNMMHKQRHGFDSGYADFVFKGPTYESHINRENLKRYARELGYDHRNLDVAYRMLTIAQGGKPEAGSMYTSMAQKILYKNKGVEVEDFSDL